MKSPTYYANRNEVKELIKHKTKSLRNKLKVN